jgi:hypothetical protein
MGVICALAGLQRYMGITLIVSVGVFLLLQGAFSWRKRIFHTVLFGCIAVLPFAGWLVYNITRDDSATGSRDLSSKSPFDVLYHMGDTVSSWLFPIHEQLWPLGLIFIAGILLLCIYHIIYKRLLYSQPWVVLASLFVLIYLTLLSVSHLRADLNVVDNRYLVPIYLPLLFVAVFFIYSFAKSTPDRQRIILFLVSIFALYPVIENARTIAEFNTWCCQPNEQPAAGFQAQIPRDAEQIIYTNHNLPLYTLPPEYGRLINPIRRLNSPDSVISENQPVYVLWFTDLAIPWCSPPGNYCRQENEPINPNLLSRLELIWEDSYAKLYRYQSQ